MMLVFLIVCYVAGYSLGSFFNEQIIAWIRRWTLLGWFNFLVCQWFFVRLARVLPPISVQHPDAVPDAVADEERWNKATLRGVD